jgi:hypothetical protein
MQRGTRRASRLLRVAVKIRGKHRVHRIAQEGSTMNRFVFQLTAAVIATTITAAAWSQQAQTGQPATGAAAAGQAGAAGAAGAATPAGVPGQAGTPNVTGQPAPPGAAAQPGTAGTSGAAQSAIPGQSGTSSTFAPSGQRQGQFTPGGQPAQGGPVQNFNNRSLATFGRVGRVPFFNDPAIRQQLQLSQGQFDQLNRAYADAFTAYNRGFENLNQNLVAQERLRQMQALEGQFNQQFGAALDSTLTDPRIRTRFNQLQSQFQGFGALNNPDFAQSLQLTAGQQQRLRLMANQWNQQMERLLRRNDNDPRLDDEFQELQLQARQQIESVLNPQQMQVWPQLVGPFYDFPRSAFRLPPASDPRRRLGIPPETPPGVPPPTVAPDAGNQRPGLTPPRAGQGTRQPGAGVAPDSGARPGVAPGAAGAAGAGGGGAAGSGSGAGAGAAAGAAGGTN